MLGGMMERGLPVVERRLTVERRRRSWRIAKLIERNLFNSYTHDEHHKRVDAGVVTHAGEQNTPAGGRGQRPGSDPWSHPPKWGDPQSMMTINPNPERSDRLRGRRPRQHH